MLTRKDFMNAPRPTAVESKEISRKYHSQFVTPELKENIVKHFGEEYLVTSFYRDYHFNTIPLNEWDAIVHIYKAFANLELLKKAGEVWSLAAGVCIMKEAARQMVEFSIH
jgi:hypothetical protein